MLPMAEIPSIYTTWNSKLLINQRIKDMYRHRLGNLFFMYSITKITTITKMIPHVIPAAIAGLDFWPSVEIRAKLYQHLSFKTIFNIIKLLKKVNVCQINILRTIGNSIACCICFLFSFIILLLYTRDFIYYISFW